MSRCASWRKVELAADLDRRRLVHPAAQIELGNGVRTGRQADERTRHVGQIDVVVRTHEAIAESDVAALDLDAIDADGRRRRTGRRQLGRALTLALATPLLITLPCQTIIEAGLGQGRICRGLVLYGRAALNLAQIEPALLIEDESGVEVVEHDALHREREGLEASVDATHTQRAPAHEISGIECVDGGEVAHGEVTAKIRQHAPIACATKLELALRADIATRNRDLGLFQRIGLDRQQIDVAHIELEIGLEWVKPQAA